MENEKWCGGKWCTPSVQSKRGQSPPSVTISGRTYFVVQNQPPKRVPPQSSHFVCPQHMPLTSSGGIENLEPITHSVLLFSFKTSNVVPCHGACASQNWTYKPATDSAIEKSHMTCHRPSDILYFEGTEQPHNPSTSS